MEGKETVAIWINKRALDLMEMPFRHNLTARDAGWQIEVLEPGRLTARFQTGGMDHYDLEKGDTIFSSGEELYLTLQRTTKIAARDEQLQRQTARESATTTQKQTSAKATTTRTKR